MGGGAIVTPSTAIKKKVLENEVKEEDLENDQDSVEEDDLEEEVPDDEAKIEEHEVAKIEKHKSPVYGRREWVTSNMISEKRKKLLRKRSRR